MGLLSCVHRCFAVADFEPAVTSARVQVIDVGTGRALLTLTNTKEGYSVEEGVTGRTVVLTTIAAATTVLVERAKQLIKTTDLTVSSNVLIPECLVVYTPHNIGLLRMDLKQAVELAAATARVTYYHLNTYGPLQRTK